MEASFLSYPQHYARILKFSNMLDRAVKKRDPSPVSG
jgi:hypothetical protein